MACQLSEWLWALFLCTFYRQHFFIILFCAAGIQWNHPLQQMSSIISNVLNIVSISPDCFVCQMEVGREGKPSFMFSKNGENFSFLCGIDKSEPSGKGAAERRGTVQHPAGRLPPHKAGAGADYPVRAFRCTDFSRRQNTGGGR